MVSVVVTSLLTGVLVSYGMTLPRLAGVIARIQFFPAAMAFSLVTIVFWLIATLLFGRIYCSTVCPLGALQDLFSRLFHRKDYHYRLALTRVRYLFIALTVGCLLIGLSSIAAWLDPYSLYARGCVYLVKPVWGWLVNIFASSPVRIGVASLLGSVTSILLLGAVAAVAAKRGRLICNTVCPVGTTLGFVSRYSIFHIDINTDLCIQCRKCEYVCKAECIDLTSHVIDTSRCVACFNCLPVCPNDAIRYTTTRHQLSIPMLMRTGGAVAGPTAGMTGGQHVESSTLPGDKLVLDRRAFLATGLVLAASPAVLAARKKSPLAGGLLEGQSPAAPLTPVTPPGVSSRQQFLERCTGCGLCISHCPTGVLRPSTTQYGLLRALHPVKNYDIARCAYTCTRCTNLCPTGALHPLTKEEKKRDSVGLARVTLSRCISWAKNEPCGKCAEACPAEAIEMQPTDAPRHGPAPTVDPALCIGCGACQYVCPAKPYKAIIVEGIP